MPTPSPWRSVTILFSRPCWLTTQLSFAEIHASNESDLRPEAFESPRHRGKEIFRRRQRASSGSLCGEVTLPRAPGVNNGIRFRGHAPLPPSLKEKRLSRTRVFGLSGCRTCVNSRSTPLARMDASFKKSRSKR